MKKKLLLISLTPFFACLTNAQVFADTSGNVYLNKVIDYAETMLQDGRDDSRYSTDTCPMFAVYLRRETNELPEFPEFRISGETFYDLDHDGGWAYRSFLNIPMMSKKNPDNWDHGQDKAHKQTVTGSDPLENGGMYACFEKLSAVTGDPKYNNAVLDALNWFADKQSTTGLYPFGEHSGWDFYYDSPTYLTTLNEDIPYNWESPNEAPLYHSWEHEPNGAYEKFYPFYEFLRENHPERFKDYCRGLWNQHFWDKDNGFFNRHGDIFNDDGWGAHPDDYYGCFPRITRIFAEVWTDAYLAFPNDEDFKEDMLFYLNKLIDGRVLDRTNSDGSLIFDRRSGGQKPQIPRQYLSMIHGVEDAANKLEGTDTVLVRKLREFATQQWDWFFPWVKPENDYKGSDWASEYALGDIYTIQNAHAELVKPDGYSNTRLDEMFWHFAEGLEDESISVYDNNARTWATMIDYMIYAYDISEDTKYLNKAKEFADYALANYFDENSKLPKCVSFGVENVKTLTTANGDIWEPPYDAQMGSADLMYSLLDLYSTISGNDGTITSTSSFTRFKTAMTIINHSKGVSLNIKEAPIYSNLIITDVLGRTIFTYQLNQKDQIISLDKTVSKSQLLIASIQNKGQIITSRKVILK